MSEPAIVIWLPLEGPPRVYADCLNEDEEARLWLDLPDEARELIEQALAFREKWRHE